MDFSKKRSNKEVGKLKLKSLVWYYHRCKDLGNIRRAEQIRIAITLLQRSATKKQSSFCRNAKFHSNSAGLRRPVEQRKEISPQIP
jgi:hypothetical protein